MRAHAPPSPWLRFWHRRRLPVLLQSEAAECGPACLAMVATHWGHAIDLAAMRRRFSVSLKGTTLKTLMEMAAALDLHARPVRLELAQLGALPLPCVLHWDMNHFVVLAAVGRTHVVIHDPAVGERRLPLREVSRHFTGVAIELAPGTGFKPAEERRRITLAQLTGRIVGLRRGLAQTLLLALTLQACLMLAPFYLQWVVDDALVDGDAGLVTVLGLGFLLLTALQSSIGAVRSWVTTTLATSLNFQWLDRAFAHLMRLPLAFFEKRHLGDIVSRFNSIQAMQRSLTTQLVEGLVDGLLSVATLAVMLLYDLRLAALACCGAALYGLLRSAQFGALREAMAEQILHASRQQTHFLESARGVQSLRLFGRADERRIHWLALLAHQFDADVRVARLQIQLQAARTLLAAAQRVLVVWIAAHAVLDGRMSAGTMLAFIGYQDQFGERMAALVDKLFELRTLRLHGERVADILLAEPEPDAGQADTLAWEDAPDIELRGLSFRYADGEPFVLEDIDLFVPAGQCLAITGASGCGKTTLVKLLLGLLEPTHGQILVGGEPLKRLGLARYRRLVGAVLQEEPLFSGSIADNIAFFDPQADLLCVQACARLAAIDDEIRAMPMGYDTMVGDASAGLSGGQKQRILLARAFYKQPRLLVLDEATSHLDLANEQLVNAAVRQSRMTRVMVAHRPETIAMAQRVVVLQGGRIVRDLQQPGAGTEGPARQVGPGPVNASAVADNSVATASGPETAAQWSPR